MSSPKADQLTVKLGIALLWVSIGSWFLLMSPMLSAGPLVLDEHGSYWIIDSDLPGTSLERSLNYAAIPPLSSWLQAIFISILGKSEFSFRLPSALCALGAIIVAYFSGKELRNPLTGGVMALLVAWHPEAMDEVRIARCYGLVLLLGSLVFYATIRWWKKPDSLSRSLLWMLSSVAILWSHYTSALLVAITGLTLASLFSFSRQLNKKVLGFLFFAAGLLVLLCYPLIPSIIRLQEWGPALNYSGAGASVGDIFGQFWWAGLPTGVLLVLILGGQRERPASGKQLLVLTMLSSILPLVILFIMSSGETSSLANPRYRVAYAPVAAGFVSLLLTSRSRKLITVLAVVCCLSTSWYFSAQSPFQLGRLKQPTAFEWKELNDFIQIYSNPDEPIFVQSGLTEGYLVPIYFNDRSFMEYVACRVSRFYVDQPHPRYALPFLWNGPDEMSAFYIALMNEEKNTNGSFWVACATDTDLNRNSLAGIQELATSQGYVSTETKTWNSATLIHYQVKTD